MSATRRLKRATPKMEGVGGGYLTEFEVPKACHSEGWAVIPIAKIEQAKKEPLRVEGIIEGCRAMVVSLVAVSPEDSYEAAKKDPRPHVNSEPCAYPWPSITEDRISMSIQNYGGVQTAVFRVRMDS